MKDQKKKLAQYTSMATAILGAGAVNGQVDYVDIQDTTVNTHKGYYDLDVDSDGTPDFRITQYLDTGNTGLIDAIFVTPFDSIYGRTMGDPQNGFNYPFKLNPGDSINFGSDWRGNGETNPGYLVSQYNGTPYPNSNWKGPVVDGYLGLRIFKTNGLHMGWVRLDIAADNRSFTVKDFAFQQTAQASILAGEPTLSEVEHMLEDLKIGQSGNRIFLEKSTEYGQIDVRVMDLSGRELATFEWTESRMEREIPGGTGQVIVVEFTFEGVRHSKKLLLIED